MDPEPETTAARQYAVATHGSAARPGNGVGPVYLRPAHLCEPAVRARGEVAASGLARSERTAVDLLVRPWSVVVGAVDRCVAKRGSTVHDLCRVRDAPLEEAICFAAVLREGVERRGFNCHRDLACRLGSLRDFSALGCCPTSDCIHRAFCCVLRSEEH